MEKDNNLERTELDVNIDKVSNDEFSATYDGVSKLSSDSGNVSNSHHHHGNHSSHRRGRGKHQKRSVFSRIKRWFKKKGKRKALVVMNACAILIAIGLLAVVFWMELGQQDEVVSDYNQKENMLGDAVTPDSSATSLTVPKYWKKELSEKTKIVKAHQTAGGKDCVSFVWGSDLHIPDNDTSKTDNLGILMAKMMNDCEIPFALLTGDIGSRSSLDDEATLLKKYESIPLHLAPLWGTNRLLVALGNHDGCYGDASCYYGKQFSPEKMWQMYFRNQALDSRRVFSDDGLYYYIDNVAQKTRFIVLNTNFGGEYSTDGNGVAVNNRFSTSCYGQEQLDWLANVALDMPEGYGAIIAAHVPPNVTYTVDKEQFIGIVNAYCLRTSFEGSYTAGVDGWTNNKVGVDFTDAKGEIIAMFTGHVHQDTVDITTLECPIITIISAGARVGSGEAPQRTFGTDTETSFDVVTINRQTRTIYCTRVGAGEDRKIKY